MLNGKATTAGFNLGATLKDGQKTRRITAPSLMVENDKKMLKTYTLRRDRRDCNAMPVMRLVRLLEDTLSRTTVEGTCPSLHTREIAYWCDEVGQYFAV